MKTFAILTLLIAVINANHLRVWASANDLPPNAIPDIITGYVDGLLKISSKGQMEHCEYFIHHAEESFNVAVDYFYQANDFWAPIPKKISLFGKGINKILSITGQILKDLQKCDLGDDAMIVDKWTKENPDFMSILSTLGQNMLGHMFGMTNKIMASITDINAKNYYNFGNDIGTMANMLLGDKH